MPRLAGPDLSIARISPDSRLLARVLRPASAINDAAPTYSLPRSITSASTLKPL